MPTEFTLDALLRHRTNIEHQRQRELAEVQAQMRPLQEELRQLDQSMQQSTEEIRQTKLIGRIDMSYLAAHRRFTASIQRKATSLIQRMALLQRQADEKRKILAEAARDRKVIDKLREKQQERWRIDIDKHETAQQDEVGMQMSVRQLQGSRLGANESEDAA